MKTAISLFGAAIWMTPSGAAMAAPPVLAPFYCPQCPVQSKVPSGKNPGQFDFKLKCIDADSGNSVVLDITAHNDSDALHTAWKSPRLDEAIMGMEANSYSCAEPPARKK
jgi:hypothetical protein